MSHLVAGLFRDSEWAGKAISSLKEKGYTKDISVISKDTSDPHLKSHDVKKDVTDGAVGGAAAGAVMGAAVGAVATLLVGAAAVVLPGVGILVLGPLGAGLAGAGGGGHHARWRAGPQDAAGAELHGARAVLGALRAGQAGALPRHLRPRQDAAPVPLRLAQPHAEGGAMNPILLGGIVEAVGKIADDLFTSDKERLDAVLALCADRLDDEAIQRALALGRSRSVETACHVALAELA